MDDVGADPIARELHREGFRERGDARLGCLVGVLRGGIAAQALDGGDVDHGAASRLPQVRNGVAAGVDHGLEVDGHHPVPQREVDVGGGAVFAEEQHPGDVHEVVQAAVAGEGAVDGALHLHILGEIALHVGGRRPLPPEVCGPGLEIEAGDGAPFPEEPPRDREAHAAAGPGHEGVSAGKAHRIPPQ